ncbi:ArsC family reductase [Pseudovibrio sp. Tun.PSC04-5.I4]|uniref:ArsC family reductase n=1 Tax=Pseudovibrio sp. Tun.PSC04-5.I4 TaxID=1798213 RepID=UPI00087E43F2|nr:ArsC family reductase [Pseudovibrio sp. Tun.PSC04-5.I4]SDR31643.1 transcriptional regulator, Spx/MgsR family [Pseudovibrio sp. Tun.PSC04-5.I4]
MYGIRNCDSVRKARKLLDEAKTDYNFHDYKKDGADEAALQEACETFGWDVVLNKRGTTWRKLDDDTKACVTDQASAIALMMKETSLIKRPLITGGKQLLLGFDAASWAGIIEKGEL